MKRITLALAAMAMTIAQPCWSQQPGDKLWEVTAPQPILSSPVVAPDGTIYVASGQNPGTARPGPGALCSFSPQGTTNWILNFGSAVVGSPSIGPDGRIYLGSHSGDFKVVTPKGEYIYIPTGGYIHATPAIAADGTVYIVTVSYSVHRLLAFTPDGALKWKFDMKPAGDLWLGSSQYPSPTIGPDGTIYVSSLDRNLYALSPEGKTNWVYRLTGITNSSPVLTYASPSIGGDGTLYIGGDYGILYAVDSRGMTKWKTQLATYMESSVAIKRDGTLYVGTLANDGQFYALNPQGQVQWSFACGFISGSPALAADGTVYVSTYWQNTLYAFNAAGSNVWSFTAPVAAGSMFASPAIGADGTIYITAGTKLYALYGSSPLMQSPSPMFRGNVQHTARSIQRGMSAPRALPDGNVALTLNLETGRVYQVKYSANLVDWAALTNFVSDAFSQQVIDPSATNSAQRYYRLATPDL